MTRLIHLQMAAYCVSAAAGAYVLFRMLIKDEEGLRLSTAWTLGRWFCRLMLCGSCSGLVTWLAWMQHVINVTSADDLSSSESEYASRIALAYRWSAAFVVFYAIEFFCLSVAKLMVLDRMSKFATPQQAGYLRMRWDMGARIVTTVVCAGNMVGVAGNVATAVYFKRTSEHFDTASEYYSANNTANALKSVREALEQLEFGAKIYTVQAFCEVAVLLVIITAFAAVGVGCSHRIKTTLLAVRRIGAKYLRSHQAAPVFAEAEVEGMQLRLQILTSTAFVFAAFLLRSVFSVMRAVAYQLQDLSNSCPVQNVCDSTCYNAYTHFSQWMFRTPEFQLTIMLLSSPLALLVALYGMTNKVIVQSELYVAQLGTTCQPASPLASGSGAGAANTGQQL